MKFVDGILILGIILLLLVYRQSLISEPSVEDNFDEFLTDYYGHHMYEELTGDDTDFGTVKGE